MQPLGAIRSCHLDRAVPTTKSAAPHSEPCRCNGQKLVRLIYFLVNEVANVGQDAITQLYSQQLRADQLS
jgi:hypothetical protein